MRLLASEWPSSRLKYLVDFVSGGTPRVDDPSNWADAGDGVPWVTIADMTSAFALEQTVRRVSPEGLKSARLRTGPAGTILFSMYASLGQVAVLRTTACWNQAVLGLVPGPDIDGRYLVYCLVALRPFVQQLARSNTQANLNAEQVSDLEVPLPPLQHQLRVADFLDHETARIDGLIEKRLALLPLLETRWLSEVWRLVTKGFHDDALTKPSGLDWIGDIPRHWRTPPVYALFDVQLGKMLNPERAAGEHQAPYLRNVNVQWDRLDLSDLPTMSFDPADRVRYRLEPGDLLVCEGGEVGRAAEWQGQMEECFYQKAIHRVRSLRGDLTRFLMYALWAAASRDVFRVEGNQATMVHLTAEKLREHRFPMPPVDEQRSLVAYLDARRARHDVLAKGIRRQINLLQERRQALITAAVTGQFEVEAA